MVRYHLDEDPKTLKVFPIPLHDSSGTTLHYDHLSISPDGRMLAATHSSTLQWLSAETGQVLDTADRVHDGFVLGKKSADKRKTSDKCEENSNCWEMNAKFQSITFWNHDNLPSQDDAFLRSLHWLTVANALHQPVTAEDLESASTTQEN